MRLFLLAALTFSLSALSASADVTTFEEDLSSMKLQYQVLTELFPAEGNLRETLANSWSGTVVQLAVSHYLSGRTVSEGEEIDIRTADGKINVGIVTDDEDDAKPASILARRLEGLDKVTVSITHATDDE